MGKKNNHFSKDQLDKIGADTVFPDKSIYLDPIDPATPPEHFEIGRRVNALSKATTEIYCNDKNEIVSVCHRYLGPAKDIEQLSITSFFESLDSSDHMAKPEAEELVFSDLCKSCIMYNSYLAMQRTSTPQPYQGKNPAKDYEEYGKKIKERRSK